MKTEFAPRLERFRSDAVIRVGVLCWTHEMSVPFISHNQLSGQHLANLCLTFLTHQNLDSPSEHPSSVEKYDKTNVTYSLLSSPALV